MEVVPIARELGRYGRNPRIERERTGERVNEQRRTRSTEERSAPKREAQAPERTVDTYA